MEKEENDFSSNVTPRFDKDNKEAQASFKANENPDYDEFYDYTQEDEDSSKDNSKKDNSFKQTKKKNNSNDSSQSIVSSSSTASAISKVTFIATNAVIIATAGGIIGTQIIDIGNKQDEVVVSNSQISESVSQSEASEPSINLILPPVYRINKMEVEDNKVNFEINLIDDSGQKMYLYLKKDSVVKAFELNSPDYYGGTFDNLDYSSTYQWSFEGIYEGTITVYEHGEISIPEKVMKTEVVSYNWQCHCEVDGHATFSLKIVDDFNYWSDYTLDIYGEEDVSVNLDFTSEEISGDHEIDVSSFSGGMYTLSLGCRSSDPKDTENNTSIDSEGKVLISLLFINIEI